MQFKNNNNNLFTYISRVTYADAHTHFNKIILQHRLYNHYNHYNPYNPDHWKYSIYNLTNFFND